MTSWMQLKKLPPLKYGEPYPLFNRVSIETVGRCTRECFFCPSRLRTKEQRGDMSDEVFDRLFEQFAELEFDGVVQMFYLGEPLLDPKLVARVAHARAACPRSKLLIVSNGDLLRSHEQVDELFDAGLNVFNADCYDQQTYKKVSNLSVKVNCEIDVRYERIKWTSSRRTKLFSVVDVSDPATYHRNSFHSYLVPEVEEILRDHGMLRLKQPKYCAMPHRRLVVWWSGEIVLCCVTTPAMKAPTVIGDYRDVLAAWNSQTMNLYRWRLQQGVKAGQCRNCVHKHAYPHVVHRIEDPR